jgi:hypothetical protein
MSAALDPTTALLFDRLAVREPLPLAARIIAEHVLPPKFLDQVFEGSRRQQYPRDLPFSVVVALMVAVVTNTASSLHRAIQRMGDTMPVAFQAVYPKVAGTELEVSEALLTKTATRAAGLVRALNATLPPLVPGRRARIVDGMHIEATERRLKVLRGVAAGPLPGFVLALLDPALGLVTDVIACEDGHANERSLTDRLLALLAAGDCLIGDRNFCTLPILFGCRARNASFLIRQHGNLMGEVVGERQKIATRPDGVVFEQQVRLRADDGREMLVRRITLELVEPTRHGEAALHLLTDIPASELDAELALAIYRERWQIEKAFGDLALWLHAEIRPLGYPRAALLGVSAAFVSYNIVSVVRASLRVVHGAAWVAEKLSNFHLASTIQEGAGATNLLTEAELKPYRKMTPAAVAVILLDLAHRAHRSSLEKARQRGPKKPPPPRNRFKNSAHVSTYKLLEEERQKRGKKKSSGSP